MEDARSQQLLESIGANVRRRRLGLQLTQEQLAEAVGIELRTIQRIETGKYNMRVAVLAPLAAALGVAPSALLKPAKMPEVKRGRPPKKRPASASKKRPAG